MLPILLTLGPIKIYSYGVLIAIAFLMGTFLIWKLSRDEEIEEEKVLDAILIGIFSGIVGARILYIIFHFQKFTPNLIRTIHLVKFPGLVFHGGLIIGTITLIFYFSRNKISFWQIGDILVLGLILGQAIVNLGCFLDGCYYGEKTTLPWGVYFPGVLGKRHPIQLYELFFNFLIFYFLFKAYKKVLVWKREKRGIVLLFYFLFFNTEKFLLEFLSDNSVYWRGVKVTQLISGGLGIITIVIIILKYKEDIRRAITNIILGFKRKKKIVRIKT